MSQAISPVSGVTTQLSARPIPVPPGLANAAEFFCIEFVAAAQNAIENGRTAFLDAWNLKSERYVEIAYIDNDSLRSAVRGYVERKLGRGKSLEAFCLRELLEICIHRQRQQRQIDRLIGLCADNDLLEELFEINGKKLRVRRRTLGCTRPSRVKAQACPDWVLEEWTRVTREGLTLAERYIAVCESTGEYPDIVKRVVVESGYDDDRELLRGYTTNNTVLRRAG